MQQPKQHETLSPVNAIMQSPIQYFPVTLTNSIYTNGYVEGGSWQDILRQNLHQDTQHSQSEKFLVHLHKHSNPQTLVTLVKRGNHGKR